MLFLYTVKKNMCSDKQKFTYNRKYDKMINIFLQIMKGKVGIWRSSL